LNPPSASFSAPALSGLSPDRAALVSSKPARPLKPSDDPVLAELERAELEDSELKSSGRDKAAADQPATESGAPAFSSYHQRRQKRRGPLVAVLMLGLAGGGFYAAWTYQPGFRAIAQPQIDRVLALSGMAHQPRRLPPAPAPNPAKPSTQPAPATTSAPASESPTNPDKTQSKAPDSATGSATASAAATAPVQPAATPGAAVAPPTSGATTTAAPIAAAATLSGAQLPGENSAIILSSKGAEKRLAHSVPPKYPVEARSGGAEGTVVLKAVVDENGKVEGVRLVEGNATLATAAIQAVKQWRYRPYVRDGKAQSFQSVVIVDFQRP
jgi:protein TonB